MQLLRELLPIGVVSVAPEASLSIQDSFFAKEGQRRSFECLDKANAYPTPSLVIEKLGSILTLMQSSAFQYRTQRIYAY